MKIEHGFIIAGIVLITLTYLILFNPFVTPKTGEEYSDFAKCLSDAGVKMYGASWCGHCQNQKALFGESFKYITFFDCDKEKTTCINAGIKGYPTWKFNGTAYPGEKTFAQLSEISGCELE